MLGDVKRARAQLEIALNLVESRRADIINEEFRTSFSALSHDYYEFYIDLLMRMHSDEPSAGYDGAALQASERARARGLVEILTEARVDIRNGVDPMLLERERSIQRQLNATSEQLTRLLSGKHTEEQEKEASKKVETLLEDYQDVEAEIRTKSPRYAALTQPQPLSPKQIQQLLDRDTLLLEYALGQERSYLWAVTANSIKSYELPKRAEIESAAQHFHKVITDNANRNMGDQIEAANYLSKLVLTPVASELGQKRLVIVTQGALQYVPFSALPIPAVSQSQIRARKAITQDYRPLIVDHEIVSLPSSSVLSELRHDLSLRTPTKMVALFADPVFKSDDPRVNSTKDSSQSGKVSSKSNNDSGLKLQVQRSASESGLQDLYRLPFSRREGESIAALAPREQVLEALDFAANRATATDEKLARYRIIHFATHVLLNNAHPELSGIVLSLVDEKGNPQDGFLRLHEIYNLRLSADLVVLSGCQTALGKQVKGEGLIGLSRGFMYAGTTRILVSLWEINDEATAELMKKFYEGMFKGGMRPAAALRTAQLKLWKTRWWKAPYYWAGFELQGEWR